MRLERQAWVHQRRDVRGYSVQVSVAKDKAETGQKQAMIEIALERAIEEGEAERDSQTT
jgi:hypothetical protein